MKRLKIKKSFYYTCGKRWGWMHDGYDIVGLGIARKWFDNKAIVVNIDGQDYHLDCEKALEFVKKYKCFENIKGTKVGYIPKNLLVKLT